MSFAEWTQTAQGVLTLISGLIRLLVTGCSSFFLIKSWIKNVKNKSAKEIWAMIMSMADAAMQQVEQSTGDKKQMAINIVKESAKAAGINIDDFLDQLSAYIDQCIAFFNGMNGRKKLK